MATRIVLALAVAAVIVAAAAGFMAIGSPALQRERRFDERRIEDLGRLWIAVEDHRSSHGGLPRSLDDIGAPAHRNFRDPLTSQPYEYLVHDDRYELCAIFQQASAPEVTDRWAHPTGRHCFAMSARK